MGRVQDWRLPRALTPYVRSAVAYDVDLGGPGVHRGLPSTGMTFVLPVGEPLDVGWAGDPSHARGPLVERVRACTRSPPRSTTTATRPASSWSSRPAGARALLGVPAAELSREIVELGDVVPALSTLPERLADAAVLGGPASAWSSGSWSPRWRRTTPPSRAPRSGGRWPGSPAGPRCRRWRTRSATAGAT